MTLPALPWPSASVRAATADDVPALVGLAKACLAADGGLPIAADESFLRRRFLDGARGVLVLDAGAVAAAAGLRTSGQQVALVHPDLRGRGLGTALLDWALSAGATRIETESLTAAAAGLFATRGLTQSFAEDVLRCDLMAPASWPPLPASITLTAWQPGCAPRFFATYQAAFRDRPGFPGWTEQQWLKFLLEDLTPQWTLLASGPDGRDVGFVAGGEGGWIVQVGVVPAARGAGLGAALTAEALRRMRADGEASALLDVNINNPGATRIYERLGFVHIGRRARYERR